MGSVHQGTVVRLGLAIRRGAQAEVTLSDASSLRHADSGLLLPICRKLSVLLKVNNTHMHARAHTHTLLTHTQLQEDPNVKLTEVKIVHRLPPM